MGCFNFERVKALVFKVFGRQCSKPTGWDGDHNAKNSWRVICLSCFIGSEPTVWDDDSIPRLNEFDRYTVMFQAHCVGWRQELHYSGSSTYMF